MSNETQEEQVRAAEVIGALCLATDLGNCTLPSRVDPYIVACSFIMSGLRVFDIRDPQNPREIAYFNKPLIAGENPYYQNKAGAFAMSAPAYDEASGDIWYTDGHSGFFVARLTGAAGAKRFAGRIVHPGN